MRNGCSCFCSLLAAAIILNTVTETSGLLHMTGNFLSLLAGAILGGMLFPDWAPPLDASANLAFALFSGMTAAALINMALLKPL